MADEDFERPALPVELTKKNWDKKKGKIAKMAGKTGMGDAFSKVEKAYKSVDWDKLEMISNKPRPFDLKKWDKMRDDAAGEMKGNLAKLRTQCYALRDLAKKRRPNSAKIKPFPSLPPRSAPISPRRPISWAWAATPAPWARVS